jgi:probable F420-dependent oxidoreductase
MRLGVNTEIAGLSLRQMVELGTLAERLGYDDAWSSESGGPDGISPLAGIAARTSRIRIGTAIVPIASRPPALAAMTAASLQELSDGRFILGLGLSTRHVVERWLGQSRDQPLLRLREYVTVVRDLLDGRRVDVVGTTLAVRGFRLKAPTRPRVPVYVAALGPGACRLAGALADGVIFFLKTPAGVKQAMAWVREGAAESGRDPALLECVLILGVAPGADGPQRARAYVAQYARVPDYARSLRLQGFADEVDAIASGGPGGAGTAPVVSPAMAEALILTPDRDDGPTALAAYEAAGVETTLLLPLRSREPDASAFDDAEMVLRTFAPIDTRPRPQRTRGDPDMPAGGRCSRQP